MKLEQPVQQGKEIHIFYVKKIKYCLFVLVQLFEYYIFDAVLQL